MITTRHVPTAAEQASSDMPSKGPEFLIEPTRHADEEVSLDDGALKIRHYESGRLRAIFRASIAPGEFAARVAASAATLRAEDEPGAKAIADLCVTGRRSVKDLRRFANGGEPDWHAVAEAARSATVLAKLATFRQQHGLPVLPAHRPEEIERTVDRLRGVLRYLEAGENERGALRPGLGWIAVSGEDDVPWRPVNVPVTNHPQHEVELSVFGVRFTMRYVIAGDLTSTSKNVLLLHGHSSRLEETEALAARLVERGYTVIAPDLPCNGYGDQFDHTSVLFGENPVRGAVKLPFENEPKDTDHHSSLYTLRFVMASIRALVDHVFARAGVPARIDLLAGGSLGGNLGLLFSQTMPGREPQRHVLVQQEDAWIRRVASWSPACLWVVPGVAHGTPHGRSLEDEEPDRRRDHINRWFNVDHVIVVAIRQAEQWYRKGWEGKGRAIAEGWLHRHEVYSPSYRRWHWIVAHEQVKYSHQHEVAGTEVGGPRRKAYELCTGPLLLMAGEGDNFANTNLFDRVKEFGPKIGAAGKALLWEKTGHSIHDERPNELAKVLDDFVHEHPL